MFNRRTFVIVKRELQSRLFSKSFILMTLLIPLFMFGMIGFQTFVYTYDSGKGTTLRVAVPNDQIRERMQDSFSKLEVVKSGDYKVVFDTLNGKTAQEYVEAYRNVLVEEKLTGLFVVPDSALIDKRILYYSSNPNNTAVFDKVRSSLNEVLINVFFKDKQLSPKEKEFVQKRVNVDGFRINKNAEIEEESAGNIIISFVFTFFLYFSLIMIGTNLMRAVVEEKSNKIVEVLLSSVNARELMTGKILGTTITGLVQMAIWLSPVILLVTTNWFTLPKEFVIKIEPWVIVYFLYNFLISLVTYLGLFAAIGAMFDSDQDAQSGIWPVMITIMIPFFIALGLVQRGDNDLSKITSMVPLLSLIVMPARIALVNVPWWQIALSIAVNLATMLSLFPLAGKIYRVGILATGKKATYKDVVKWLKFKY